MSYKSQEGFTINFTLIKIAPLCFPRQIIWQHLSKIILIWEHPPNYFLLLELTIAIRITRPDIRVITKCSRNSVPSEPSEGFNSCFFNFSSQEQRYSIKSFLDPEPPEISIRKKLPRKARQMARRNLQCQSRGLFQFWFIVVPSRGDGTIHEVFLKGVE